MRPAPRSRAGARGRAASRVQWDKLGRVALVLVLFVVLASYVNPALDLVDAWRDANAEQRSLAELRAENERLRQRAAGLDGPDAAERGARRLGMVAPGERSYVIK